MIVYALANIALAQSPDDPNYQPPPVFADVFRPSVDSGPWLATESAALTNGNVVAGAHLSWANRPFTWTPDGGTADDRVDILSHAVALHLGGRFTIGPLELGAAAPAYLLTTGLGFEGNRTVLGDPTVQAKVAFRSGAVAAGILLKGGAPLGGSERQVGVPGLFWEAGLLAQAISEPVEIGANVGLRGVPEQLLDGARIDDHAWLRVAAALTVGERWVPAVEFVAQRNLTEASPASSPAELSLQIQHRFASGARIELGVGPGLGDAVGTPSWRGVLGVTVQRHPTSD